MATGILGIGASALIANQQALATVSHNIANATVDGYSRQSVELQARLPQLNGGNFFGKGVDLVNVRRHVDIYINEQISGDISRQGQLSTEQTYLTRIDNLLANESTGLSPAFDRFFAAMQDMSLDPSSLPQREVVLQRANDLVQRFNTVSQSVGQMEREINLQIGDQVSQINTLATNLAELNKSIAVATAQGAGQAASDLLDQRDRLHKELSGLVKISTITQSDGSTNVFMGDGQALVVGTNAFSLSTQPNSLNSSRLDITYQGLSGLNITDQVTGGSLGGLLNSRQEVIDPVVNQLGQLAVALEQSMNDQHRLGMDLNGQLGADLFNTGQPIVAAGPGNTVDSMGVTISDPNLLTGADYRINVDASGDYIATNLDAGSAWPLGPGPTADLDGLTFSLSTGSAGDSFLVQPTRGLASSLSLVISDPRKLAAASPVLVTSDFSNQGAVKVGDLQVTDTANAAFTATAGALEPPILIKFIDANNYQLFDNSSPATPVSLGPVAAYTPGEPLPGLSTYGYELQLTGDAVAGDQLTVGYNTSGVGGNQNMLAMIGLQDQNVLSSDTATYQESYQQLVGGIGARTSSGEVNLDSVGFTLEQAQARQQSVAGVNLDEEAAKLLEFQQAYQAAAQTIRAADKLFQSLLEVV